jgi:hypothetical protein
MRNQTFTAPGHHTQLMAGTSDQPSITSAVTKFEYSKPRPSELQTLSCGSPPRLQCLQHPLPMPPLQRHMPSFIHVGYVFPSTEVTWCQEETLKTLLFAVIVVIAFKTKHLPCSTEGNSTCTNTKWKSTSSKKFLLPHMGDGVDIASVRSKNLIKARMQHEETKINLPWAKLIVGSDHLCNQAINLIGEAMIILS